MDVDLDLISDLVKETDGYLPAQSRLVVLSHSPLSKLISLQEPGITQNITHIEQTRSVELPRPVPRLATQPGAVIAKIEDLLQQMVECIMDEKKYLAIHFRSRRGSGASTIDTETGAIRSSSTTEVRTVRFPGKTAQEAWKFTALLRILELSHEALVAGVVTSKRDIYYRDPKLFLKQQVVDRYVDDIAYNLGVKREALNIMAAAKGLVAGSLTIAKLDRIVINCDVEKEGILIPRVSEIENIDIGGVTWVLVIEKEATFRSLVANQFWKNSPAGKGILVTGKGYPDILTRTFVRFLSNHSRLGETSSSLPQLRIFGLMDFDPDGLAILSTYKHGSFSLAHENHTLVAPKMEWLGITSAVMRDISDDEARSWLAMTHHDRRKAVLMLQKPAFQVGVEASLRRELQVMLVLNTKAEIQAIGEPSKLENFISLALCRLMSSTVYS